MGVVTDVCGFAGNGAHFDADDYSTSMALTKSYRANGNFVFQDVVLRTECAS